MEFRCAHSGRQLEPGLEVAVERLECRHCDSHHQFLLPRTCRATYSLLLTRSTPTWYERVLWLLLTATLCKSTKRLCFVQSFLSADVFLHFALTFLILFVFRTMSMSRSSSLITKCISKHPCPAYFRVIVDSCRLVGGGDVQSAGRVCRHSFWSGGAGVGQQGAGRWGRPGRQQAGSHFPPGSLQTGQGEVQAQGEVKQSQEKNRPRRHLI